MYVDALRELSSVLYAHDPDGMGSTVSAPEDEYDGPAASMLASLKDGDARADERYVRGMYPEASDRLVAECSATLSRFRHRSRAG